MKKILFFVLVISMTSFLSCGGGEVKNEDKQEEGKEVKKDENADAKKEDESKKSEAVPQIDVASLNDEASILDAMNKVVEARRMDDSLRNADKNYKGHFVKLLKLNTAVVKRATEFSKTLKGDARVEFIKKYTSIN
jgi:hypothetical protein